MNPLFGHVCHLPSSGPGELTVELVRRGLLIICLLNLVN